MPCNPVSNTRPDVIPNEITLICFTNLIYPNKIFPQDHQHFNPYMSTLRNHFKARNTTFRQAFEVIFSNSENLYIDLCSLSNIQIAHLVSSNSKKQNKTNKD
jgi:hypothetical protein